VSFIIIIIIIIVVKNNKNIDNKTTQRRGHAHCMFELGVPPQHLNIFVSIGIRSGIIVRPSLP